MEQLGKSVGLLVLMFSLLSNSWALVCPNHFFAFAAPGHEHGVASGHHHPSPQAHDHHERQDSADHAEHGGLQEAEFTCHVSKDLGAAQSNERPPDQSLAHLLMIDPDADLFSNVLVSGLIQELGPYASPPEVPPKASV